MLLDEPTSALDHENERLVWDQLRNNNGKTIIMVTHSLLDETVFDRIYRVENGNVRQIGAENGGEII